MKGIVKNIITENIAVQVACPECGGLIPTEIRLADYFEHPEWDRLQTNIMCGGCQIDFWAGPVKLENYEKS